MANLRFNDTGFSHARPRVALAIGILLTVLGTSMPTARADEVKVAPVSASEKQEIAYLRGAWWMGRGIHDFLWNEFDPNTIPVLLVERRPGRPHRALLTGHPAPPSTFTLVAAAKDDLPAIYGASEASLPPAGSSPPLFAGHRTAVFIMGETVPDTEYGSPAAEQILPRIIHEMAHVYALSKGMAADLVPAAPPAFTPTPEVIALAGVENRILVEFLYADAGKTLILEEMARQFIAVRRARWAMMGKAADYEKRVELFEAPAYFAQLQVLKLASGKQIEPPPFPDADPSYHSFQFGLLWRLNSIIGKLTDTPTEAAHLISRIPIAAAAQGQLLGRLGVDWAEKSFKGDKSLLDLLSERVAIEPVQQESALTAARATYGYEAAVALAKERLAGTAGR